MTFRAKWLACVALPAAVVGGCGWRKQHLTAEHGKSYADAFSAQSARTTPAEAVTGLDSQEAAIISGEYRAGLAASEPRGKAPPVLLVAPPTRERPQPLAPSVPAEK